VIIHYNVPLAKYTTFGIGGPARIFITAESEQDIINVVTAYRGKNEMLRILGGGSNVLISDGGVDGAVLHIGRGFDKIVLSGDTVRAESGARLSRVAYEAGKAGLTGLEWAAHIPGTLGGAVFMNAGAYGGDMSAVTESVRVVSDSFQLNECGFSYRRSVFQTNGGIITGAVLRLKRGNADDIKCLTNEYYLKRKNTQPSGQRSAGSVFKNMNGVPAAKYIDALNLKGLSVGGARVSTVHANFIVNTGGATCSDVLSLIEIIKEKVYNAYGVTLETEIKNMI